MRRRTDVHVFDTPAAAIAAAAAAVGAHASAAIEERSQFCLSLTGGGVAHQLYPLLAGDARGLVDWSRTHVWWGDERAVPPDHPDSNYHAAWEHLLSRVTISRDAIHRMPADDPDPDRAAREYEATLPPRFDLVLLGIGPDAHVCSLFPGRPAVRERVRLVVPVEDSPKPPPRRMTVTPPVLESARRLLVVAWGEEKADALAAAFAAEGTVEAVPARLARGGTWIVDRAAASRLPDRQL